jgi:uncharacterized protein (DUF1330 family)
VTAYVVYEAVVTDAEQYERYKTAAAASLAAAGGRYVARGGEVESFEGAAPARVVILAFPTLDGAVAWYHSEQYGAARALRESACDARMFVVDGTD